MPDPAVGGHLDQLDDLLDQWRGLREIVDTVLAGLLRAGGETDGAKLDDLTSGRGHCDPDEVGDGSL